MKKTKLTILYDNQAAEGLRSAWGFSCLIEHKSKLLFDTGWNSRILLHNMEQMAIDPKAIETVVISHNHWDHKGGLRGLLKANGKKAKVYSPKDFSKPTEICNGIYSTGMLGRIIKEQSIIMKLERGVLLITGCAHPGLGKIIEVAKKFGNVCGVLGGFHGFSDLKKLEGIDLLAPCHCTKHINRIMNKYPEQYREIMAGSVLHL